MLTFSFNEFKTMQNWTQNILISANKKEKRKQDNYAYQR